MIIPSVSGSGNTLEIIASASDAATLIVEVVGGKGKRVGLTITKTALAQALRNVGLYVATLAEAERALQELTNDQTAKLAAIESLVEEWKTRGSTLADAAHEILRIIHPDPPYEFPRKRGAVITARHRDGNSYAVPFTYAGGLWVSDQGNQWSEDGLSNAYRDFKTISEGTDLP